MAERKAVNKYYPPDWDPRKGSLDKRLGQHPLRDRARKLSQGILIIRFELPYNIWCGGCGNHVGMGVRYNAEKSKVGNYYTTPIYKFRMKCHLCDNHFEIQTDPKNHDYVILCGARRKEQRWDPVANEQIVPEDKATQKKMAMDAMYKLEHGSDDQVRGKDKAKTLSQLQTAKISMKEDYLLNRMARDKFRTEKRQLKEAAEADKSLLERGSLDIQLLEESEEDKNLAGLLKYSVTSSFEEKQLEKRKSIEKRPLFDPEKNTSTLSADTPSSSSSRTDSSLDGGDNSKQKLSEAIRFSQKDPFSLSKPVKIFNASANKPSILGVRLKGSRVMKKYTKRSKAKEKTLASLSLQTIHPAKKDFSQQSRTESSVEDNREASPMLENTFVAIPDGSNPSKDLETVSNSNPACDESPSVVSVFNSSCDHYAKEEDASDSQPHVEVTDTSNSSQNLSGLSILMNSYDGDSDSSNSSS